MGQSGPKEIRGNARGDAEAIRGAMLAYELEIKGDARSML